MLNALFQREKPVIGVIHLPPLPGSPLFSGTTEAIFDYALSELEKYKDSPVSGIIIENFNDVPFYPKNVPAETIAMMAALTRALSEKTTLPLGVNVLRNDAHAALAIAHCCGGQFIRVNIHTGAAVADQGLIQGKAWHSLRLRKQLGAETAIFADVQVKHAAPLAAYPLIQEAKDVIERGLADAIILSGSGTGQAVDIEQLAMVRAAVQAPVFIGSGTSPEMLPELYPLADGFIVGSYFKRDGKASNAVDPERIKTFFQAYERLSV